MRYNLGSDIANTGTTLVVHILFLIDNNRHQTSGEVNLNDITVNISSPFLSWLHFNDFNCCLSSIMHLRLHKFQLHFTFPDMFTIGQAEKLRYEIILLIYITCSNLYKYFLVVIFFVLSVKTFMIHVRNILYFTATVSPISWSIKRSRL